MENKNEVQLRVMQIEDYQNVYNLWMTIDGFGIRSIDDSYEGVKPYETFSNIGHTSGIWEDVVLLTTKANKVSKMDIYIWIEDADLSSNAVVYDSYLEVHMRFRAVVKDVVNGQ